MSLFDETSMRGLAANIGTALERAYLAYLERDIPTGQAWDLLAHEMAALARTAARGCLTTDGKVDIANRLSDLREQASVLYGPASSTDGPLKGTRDPFANPAAASVPVKAASKPRKAAARKNGPSYTTATESKPSRCRGCGMQAGKGHFTGCFDRSVQTLQLPKWTAKKVGSAAWMKSKGKLLQGITENNETLERQRDAREAQREATRAMVERSNRKVGV